MDAIVGQRDWTVDKVSFERGPQRMKGDLFCRADMFYLDPFHVDDPLERKSGSASRTLY